MLAALGPKHDHTTHYQGGSYGDGVEQVMVNQVGKQHPQDHRGHKGDQQVGGETLRLLLLGQAQHHVENLAAKLPDHGKDRAQLNDDVEGHRPLTTEIDQVRDNDLVTGTGNRQELGQAFDNTQNDGLQASPKIHYSPTKRCRWHAPVVICKSQSRFECPVVLPRQLVAQSTEKFSHPSGMSRPGRNPIRPLV
ncbi:hypothetical protein D3C81_950880 [compost metagenome]